MQETFTKNGSLFSFSYSHMIKTLSVLIKDYRATLCSF